jgi:predicted nucleic acid-binding Zn ribbon protein
MNEGAGVEARACPLCGAGLEPDQSVCPHCGRIVRRGRGSESSQARLVAPLARGIAGVLGITFVAMALGSLVNGTEGATAPDQGTLNVLPRRVARTRLARGLLAEDLSKLILGRFRPLVS